MNQYISAARRFTALLFSLALAFASGQTLRLNAAQAGTVHLPDLHTIIPLADMSIVHPTPTTREFRYTHITSNVGDGPFELRPEYDPTTDTARGFQRFYTHDASGTWSMVREAPVVGTFAFHATHGHFHFPFAQFGLFEVAPDGSLGAPAAMSPKIGFCIIDSLQVANIPHAGVFGYANTCSDPRAIQGLSVGFGDRYDMLDDGQSIDITNLPDGFYWFRALSDPYNYLIETDESNNATDIKVQISGTTVTVVAGPVYPNSQPPSVSMTEPDPGNVSGPNVLLSADASDPSGISSLQFLVDGNPLGTQFSGPPYIVEWDTTTVPDGTHYLSAQATALSGFHGTAAPVAVTVSNSGPPPPPPAFYISNVFAANRTSSSVTITWITNAPASSQVDYGLDSNYGASVSNTALTASHALDLTGLDASTTYHYKVTSQDGVGNVAAAGDFIFSTAAVSELSCKFTTPLDGQIVSGTTLVSVESSGTASISGVQFQLDGSNLGAEDESFPYSIAWDTSSAARRLYVLTAIARDPTGNHAECGPVNVTVGDSVPGLIAAYGFNEIGGTTASDASGNGRHGAISGATSTAAGYYDRALTFDGINDWVSVLDAAALHLTGGMTLEAWINPTALSGWRTVILKETPSSEAYALYAHDGAPRPAGYVNIGGSEFAAIGSSALRLNAWTHLATTYDGAMLRLFVNGVQVGSRAQTGNIISSTNALRIGGNAVWGEYFTGVIDEVRIYDRALTQAQIQNDMSTPVGVQPADNMPPTISAVASSIGTGGTVAITWTTDEASNSRVDYGTNPSSLTLSAINPELVTAHSLALSALAANTTYYYRVTSVDAANNAATSPVMAQAPLSFTTLPPSISIADTSITEGNTGTVNVTFSVTLSGASTQTVTVNYATANGMATAGSDYVTTSGTLTFAEGTTSQAMTVVVNGDTLDEANETVLLNLSNPTNATLARSQAVGTIVDDDPAPSISISDVSVTEGNAGAVNAVFSVSLSTASGQTVTVAYSTANGTALAGSDYVTTSGTSTFAAGTTSQTIIVSVLGDTLNEANENFQLNLSSPTNATLARAQGLGTIVNDDPVPSMSIADVSVTEGNSGTVNAVFPVTLSATSGQTVTVVYATADGTATAGADYSGVSGTVTFAPGTINQTISVAVTGDTLVEPNETFFVNLSNPTNATVTRMQAVGTILNDEGVPSLSIPDVSVAEGNAGTTTAIFTVTLSPASTQTVTVNYATANGTATAGSDYVATSGALTFAPGTTSQPITVVVNGDTVIEPTETFTVTLSNPTNAVIGRAQGTGTITNDDNVGLVAAYGFNETSGSTAVDASGNGLHGTISGATRMATGPYGRALTFDGVNDWVTVNDAAALHLTRMTLEAWVRPTALSGWRTVILKETPTLEAYALYAHDGAPRPAGYVNIGGSEFGAIGTSAPPLNTWTHLAATYDGTTLRLFVNGGQVGSRVVTGNIVASTSALRFGGNAVWGEYFTGDIDEIRIYNRALTAAEITSDMNKAVAP